MLLPVARPAYLDKIKKNLNPISILLDKEVLINILNRNVADRKDQNTCSQNGLYGEFPVINISRFHIRVKILINKLVLHLVTIKKIERRRGCWMRF